MSDESSTSFGVFKPVGHLVISFPSAAQADAARRALSAQLGLDGGDTVRAMTDRQMLAQVEHDLQAASPLANLGQELNLAKARGELARMGYHFLVVRAEGDLAARVAECARSHGAERAQRYGRLVIEELIQHPSDLPQVAESPDRGADAQTPSGTEAERARMRPASDQKR